MANPLRVLVVDDDPGMREGMAMSLKRAGFVIEQARSGEDALRLTRPGAFDAVVTDLRMTGMDGLQLTARLKALDSALPVLLVTAFGSLDTAREAMRLGAFDYLSKPFSPDELVQAVRKAIRSDDRLKAEEPGEAPVILTQDPVLAETLALARRAADSRATILIQAESGTGKELLAKLIHAASPRRKAAFVAINCAAIPENLLESELFGFEKGAFTGATSAKSGRFEQAVRANPPRRPSTSLREVVMRSTWRRFRCRPVARSARRSPRRAPADRRAERGATYGRRSTACPRGASRRHRPSRLRRRRV